MLVTACWYDLGRVGFALFHEGANDRGLSRASAILIVPLFDSAMAIVRRKLTGRSIYTTDRAHLHHNIKERGFF